MPEWQHADDVQLVKRAQDGDAEAFGRLYEQYAPAIFRFLFSHLDNRLDAEDLTAEVFMRTWRALPRYRQKGVPFVAFLFRVARNALTDYYRNSSRRGINLSLEASNPAAEDMDPADTVVASAEQVQVREVLGQLREDYRIVLELRFFSNLRPEEVASVMGRSPGAIRVLQHRALAALRKLITGS